jgi:DedD protein
MRFEIRTGGALAILIGLGLLSGSVFLLGLVAGYEMGRQQEGSRQFADVYPLPSPPAIEPSPAPANPPAAEAAPVAAPAPTPAAAVASVPPPLEEAPLPPPEAAPESPASAPAVPARPKVAKSTAPGGLLGSEEPDITAPLSSPRKKGYSIQIEAVMDRGGADAMVSRLRGLGYDSYLVHSLIGGATWYRVRVGPFATEQDAQAAEQKLHAAYNASLSAH